MDELLDIIRDTIDPDAYLDEILGMIVYEGKDEIGCDGVQMVDEDEAWYMLEALNG